MSAPERAARTADGPLRYTWGKWGCAFSSRWLTRPAPRALASFAKTCLSSAFSLLFPDECRLCGQPLRQISRVPVCGSCLSAAEPLRAEYCCAQCLMPFANHYPLDERGLCALCRGGHSEFDSTYAFGAYEGALRELILLFKYGRVQALAPPLARLLRRAVPHEGRFDFIVPMPLHWKRRWWRGFNQAGLLAREISRHTGVPAMNAARRTRPTAVQAGLGRSARRRNVTGAFSVRRPEAVRGKRILLVDDVMTTGATAAACARTLKRAGAAKVSIVVLARAGRWASPGTFEPAAGDSGGLNALAEKLSSTSQAAAKGGVHSNTHFTRSFEDAQPGSPA